MYTSLLFLACLIGSVSSHGYMQNPPARNCMWRFGFPNPPNYTDNENFCGGAVRMAKHGGKCGVCGDEYGKTQHHNDGGRYSNGIIGRHYKPGQTIDVEVLLTASHFGYFEFRINDFTNKQTVGDSVGKLKGYLLPVSTGGTKFKVTKTGKYLYKMQVTLPPNLTCKRCVMQWWYRGGNSWGCDESGCGLGHGPQEHFVNCADVSIGDGAPPNPQTNQPTRRPRPPTRGPTNRPRPTTERPAPPTRQPTGNCKAIGSWKGNPHMDAWCKSNCKMGNCPSNMCKCE